MPRPHIAIIARRRCHLDGFPVVEKGECARLPFEAARRLIQNGDARLDRVANRHLDPRELPLFRRDSVTGPQTPNDSRP